MKKITFFLILFNLLPVHAYSLKQFKDFEKKWKLVTVRYRSDTGELRFTYANPIAYKALKENNINFPDGSVFAKIGYKTEDDQAFISSKEPTAVNRYQFMIRDKKKFAKNNGWDYALFNGEGTSFPGDPEDQITACAACHNIIPERGYVFSQLINNKKTAPVFLLQKLKFETVDAKMLPDYIKKHLPENSKNVRSILGDLTKFFFQGTLDEIKPTLARESFNSSMPAILKSEKGNHFSIVHLEDENAECVENGQKGKFMVAKQTMGDAKDVKTLHFCFTN